MPQGPYLIDQVQIEPGSGDTLLVYRDSGTGSLAFKDAQVTGGLLLSQLAGLRSVTNVKVVGKAGYGAQYTTIQNALDTVPASASATNPYIVLVMPGRYDETVNIIRDGVHLVGLGQPEIRSALEATPDAPGADHTITISAQLGTIPLFCLIQGFKISNAHSTKSAVRIAGAAASTLLGTGGLFLRDCEVNGDSATGNYNLYGSTAGLVTAERTNFGGDALSLLRLEEMSTSSFRFCKITRSFNFRYEVGQDEPAGGHGNLVVEGCPNFGDGSALVPAVAIDCDGSGVSWLSNTTMFYSSRIQYSGTSTHYADNCILGQLSVLGAVDINLRQTKHAGLLAPNAGSMLNEDVRRGDGTLGAVATVAVVFDIPFSDADYQVSLELDSRPANDESPWITNKAGTGFTINFQTAQAMTVEWVATRQ